MTTLILDGYIVNEIASDGKMFYYSSNPVSADGEFMCSKEDDLCYNIDLPIKYFLIKDVPMKCKITIELDK